MTKHTLTKELIIKLILNDKEWMQLLTLVEELHLPDCWIAAGTLRNYLWNVLTDNPKLDDSTDIDVVFFDPTMSYEETVKREQQIKETFPNYHWELKNQVYMHIHNPNTAPYQSATDAISKFPERCTAIAIRLKNGTLDLYTPYGLTDIDNFVVHPTNYVLEDAERCHMYNQRLQKKNWIDKYPNLSIHWA